MPISHPTKLSDTELQYPLLFAASFDFAVQPLPSPLCSSHISSLMLSRDINTRKFQVLQYHDTSCSNSASFSNSSSTDEKKPFQWMVLHSLDYTNVQAYLSDSSTKIRILGWNDDNNDEELQIYLDLQFVDEECCRAFMDEWLDAVASWSVGRLSCEQMSRIFQKAPER
jgi:hypothetical protein